MERIVMKFGGTSVADMDSIRVVARHVETRRGVEEPATRVAVVVSAMSGQDQRAGRTGPATCLADAYAARI